MAELGYSMNTLKLIFQRVKLPWALSFEPLLLALRYMQRKNLFKDFSNAQTL